MSRFGWAYVNGVITGSGGSATAGGSDKQVQFNSGSAFSGSQNFVYNYPSGSLQLGTQVTASGQYSFAQGERNVASGYTSHAQGIDTTANAAYSHAEGDDTTASGVSSHAEGQLTLASGVTSHAEGIYSIASGGSSHAEGNTTLASAYGTHAEGYFTTASQNYAHAEGVSTKATNYGAHSEGELTLASGEKSHAEGYNTVASANYSHAEGYEAQSTALSSHAEGLGTQATNIGAHSEGHLSLASGYASHAEGYQTTASAYYCHAEGVQTVAAGDYSHAEGNNTKAVGTYSHAGGIGTIASGSAQTVYGKYNKQNNSTSLFVIGNGTSDGSRSDILLVNTDNVVVSGSLRVSGTLYATEYQTTVVSSSIIYSSGSTKFGDDVSDTHQFTGSIYGGIISGTTGQFTTVSGSTVTGTLGLFTNITASYISGGIISYTSVTASQISNVDYIDFNTGLAAAPTFTTGRLFYNPDTGDLAYDTSITDVLINIGQQTVVKVVNNSGAQINKGKLVYISGGVGDNPQIYTASWDTDTTSARTIGMVVRDISNGSNGYVILNGVITKVDTAAYLGGTTLYLSSSGDYTSTKPTQPLHGVRIGEVVRQHATVGSIFINIQNGFEIEELHDVLITTPAQGNLLTYNSSSALWVNSNQLSGNYGITGSLSTTNALTASAISASGTDSRFLFATFDNISVTAGAVNATIGNATPSTGKFTTLSASSTIQAGGAITGSGGMNISGGPTNIAGGIGQNFNISAATFFTGPNVNFASNTIVSGSMARFDTVIGKYATYSSNFTVPATSYFNGISSTSSVITASLTGSTSYYAGQTLIFKDIGGNASINNILIQPSGSDTIDGASGGVLITTNSGSVTIISNGTNGFYIVGVV